MLKKVLVKVSYDVPYKCDIFVEEDGSFPRCIPTHFYVVCNGTNDVLLDELIDIRIGKDSADSIMASYKSNGFVICNIKKTIVDGYLGEVTSSFNIHQIELEINRKNDVKKSITSRKRKRDEIETLEKRKRVLSRQVDNINNKIENLRVNDNES